MQEMRFLSLGKEDPLEKENGSPLQYSCLENPTDREAWWATVHGIARVGHNFVTKPPPPMAEGPESSLESLIREPYAWEFLPHDLFASQRPHQLVLLP